MFKLSVTSFLPCDVPSICKEKFYYFMYLVTSHHSCKDINYYNNNKIIILAVEKKASANIAKEEGRSKDRKKSCVV